MLFYNFGNFLTAQSATLNLTENTKSQKSHHKKTNLQNEIMKD